MAQRWCAHHKPNPAETHSLDEEAAKATADVCKAHERVLSLLLLLLLAARGGRLAWLAAALGVVLRPGWVWGLERGWRLVNGHAGRGGPGAARQWSKAHQSQASGLGGTCSCVESLKGLLWARAR
jgi:hypothetical protein